MSIMALKVMTAYYSESKNQTVVTVAEEDSSIFVRYDALLSGDQMGLKEAELLELSKRWFNYRYIESYAQQQLDEKIEQYERMSLEMNQLIANVGIESDKNKQTINSAISELTNLISELYIQGMSE